MYSIYQQVSEFVVQKNDADHSQVVPSQQHFLDHEQISYTKHVLIIDGSGEHKGEKGGGRPERHF